MPGPAPQSAPPPRDSQTPSGGTSGPVPFVPDPHATLTSPAYPSPHDSTPSSTTNFDHGRFLPGTVLAQRYRIVELLGKGGMGEVYRVDDLRLGQVVALKFLTETNAAESGAMAALLNEVRTARVVAHPNVCRVYDVGEIDGLLFISMEYVDGEHLHSLIRRIGRLANDKAIEIARQLCHGLAAIHQQGLLHRDLKPTNIMLDGRGRVRITDFGLAGLARELAASGARAGTPAYMSPEQVSGHGVSVQSDLYALGLVLYELFTGRRAFEGRTWTDYVHLHQQHVPPPPTSLVPDLDVRIEQLIAKCLEKDPLHRPASALAIAAALPGGDPLAAALAAGDTPSPEQVAAARPAEGLRPMAGLLCLLATVAGICLAGFLQQRATYFGLVEPEYRPEVLADRARTILADAGHRERPADTAFAYRRNAEVAGYIDERLGGDWSVLARGDLPALGFWYRQSPRRLQPLNTSGVVRPDDPPPLLSGMASVALDARGRLLTLEVVPPQVVPPAATQPADSRDGPDWAPLFRHAGFEPAQFAPAVPEWNPPTYSDAHRAWVASGADPPVRIEAASYAGRPTWFAVLRPWDQPTRMPALEGQRSKRAGELVVLILLAVLLAGGVLLTWRNLQLGRGDRKGAFRVAVYLLLIGLGGWLLETHRLPETSHALDAVIRALGPIAFFAGTFWLLYMALEPSVRRRWPHRLVSWTRVLSGRFNDALVGRDVLIGIVVGVALAQLRPLEFLVPQALGLPTSGPAMPQEVGGWLAAEVVGVLLSSQSVAIFNGLIFVFLPLLIYIVVRREWAAALLAAVVWTTVLSLRGELSTPAAATLTIVFAGLHAAVWTWVALRFGLLTITVQFFTLIVLNSLALTLDFGAWYAGATLVTGLALLALAAGSFYASLGGRPLLRGELLEA